MQLNHKDIDHFASAMLLFNSVLLLAIIVQCYLRKLLIIDYSDMVLVCISTVLALLVTNKNTVNVTSRSIHKIFGFDV